ncbi:MAG: murein biosynthesis integral membrane protein MurJ [Candidatus Omnitrophota bacterium]
MSTDKMPRTHSLGNILRSTSIMSLGTLASRVLGFARDIIFARFFGTAAGADAFVLAFRLPNLFRDLIGEGAANSSFVPVMTEYKEKKPLELAEFLNAATAWAFIVLCGITLVCVLFAPAIVHMMAPGFAEDAGKLRTTVDLTRIMFPYLVLIGLTALFSSVQFTYGAFMMPAFGPCLLNIALIASTLMAVSWMREPVYGLALGVIAGGIMQFIFQWRALARHGIKLAWPRALRHPGAAQIGKLLVPRLVGSAVYQLNIFVDTICASLSSIVGAGGISAIYYANRIVLFPMGVFGVALAAATLPAFARHVVADNKAELRRTIVFALENIFFVMLPTTIFLCLLAEPLTRVIFQRGVFDAASTEQTASVLFYFSLGLMGYGGVKILASAFHAMQDTRMPVKAALVCLGVNVFLNVVLMFPMKLAGIALASAIASLVNVSILFVVLERRIGGLTGAFRDFFMKLFIAGLVMGLVIFGAWQYFGGVMESVRFLLVAFLGGAVYFGAAYVLGLSQARQVGKLFKR